MLNVAERGTGRLFSARDRSYVAEMNEVGAHDIALLHLVFKPNQDVTIAI